MEDEVFTIKEELNETSFEIPPTNHEIENVLFCEPKLEDYDFSNYESIFEEDPLNVANIHEKQKQCAGAPERMGPRAHGPIQIWSHRTKSRNLLSQWTVVY